METSTKFWEWQIEKGQVEKKKVVLFIGLQKSLGAC